MALADRRFQIIFLSLVLRVGTNPLPLDSLSPVEDTLSRCIAKIANEYFNNDLPTALFIPYREYESHSYISTNDSHVDFLVQSLHQRINHPLVVLDYHNNPQPLKRKVKLGSYIIILSGEVSSYIDMAYKVIVTIYNIAGHMSPSGRLLIATTGSPNKEKITLISTFFHMIWKILQISEAIVSLPRIRTSAEDYIIEVYKWYPEEQNDPCLLSLNRFSIFSIPISVIKSSFYSFELLENNIVTDMRGCVMNISVQELPPHTYVKGNGIVFGPIAVQLKILFEALNLRMDLNPTNFKTHPNLELPRILSFEGNHYFHINHDCVATYPYFIDNLKWLIPAGAPVPRWKSLVKIFNPLMWFCVVTTFISGSTTSWLLLKQSHQSMTYISALLDTLMTYVAAGISDRYKGTVASTFFLLWLFYCLIINTAYQSALISFLNDPGQEQPIRSLEELHESGLQLISKVVFEHPEGEELLEINNYESCHNNDYCLKMIAQNRNAAMLLAENQVYFFMHRHYDSEINKYLISIIDESAYTMYLTMATYTHGCLFFKRMEQIVHRIWRAGLIMRYIQHYQFHERRVRLDIFNNDPFVITLSHLQGGFFFLISGLFLSVTVFLIEIMYHAVDVYKVPTISI
ncbi:Ionotropic receptor 460 [Blattella germanica]|nr:Ionotropic receptor 460 [Blattella germanica]